MQPHIPSDDLYAVDVIYFCRNESANGVSREVGGVVVQHVEAAE